MAAATAQRRAGPPSSPRRSWLLLPRVAPRSSCQPYERFDEEAANRACALDRWGRRVLAPASTLGDRGLCPAQFHQCRHAAARAGTVSKNAPSASAPSSPQCERVPPAAVQSVYIGLGERAACFHIGKLVLRGDPERCSFRSRSASGFFRGPSRWWRVVRARSRGSLRAKLPIPGRGGLRGLEQPRSASPDARGLSAMPSCAQAREPSSVACANPCSYWLTAALEACPH
jgi:hypothetical protein